jgi:hypothetical protein
MGEGRDDRGDMAGKRASNLYPRSVTRGTNRKRPLRLIVGKLGGNLKKTQENSRKQTAAGTGRAPG